MWSNFYFSHLTNGSDLIYTNNKMKNTTLFQVQRRADNETLISTCGGGESRARIFKRLCIPGIDSKEWNPPAYVAWRAGTITLFLLGS